MSDIAKKAGVSRPTVSVVLNQRDDVIQISSETRKKVLDAASELNYRRNELARVVGSGKNHMIGFLSIAPHVEFTAQMMVGALDEAERNGYTLKILRLFNDVVDLEVINRCVGLRLSGVVVVHLHHEPSLEYLHTEFTRHSIPLAILDSSFPHPWGIRVVSNDEVGAAAAAQHLIDLGHRRIAFIGGGPDSGSSVMREAGFRRTLKAAGLSLSEADVANAKWDPLESDRITREFLSRSPRERPTAIFCASDHLALACIRAARRSGLRVPEELSIVGYGNLARTDLTDPPLTTIEQPFYEMGTVAVQQLLARTEAQTASAKAIDAPALYELNTKLILRESTWSRPAPTDNGLESQNLQ